MRPRDYAAEVLALPTREDRTAALEEVPAEYRALVRRHVETAWAKARARRRPTPVED